MLGSHGNRRQRIQHVVASHQRHHRGLPETRANHLKLRTQHAAQRNTPGAIVARMLNAVERDLAVKVAAELRRHTDRRH